MWRGSPVRCYHWKLDFNTWMSCLHHVIVLRTTTCKCLSFKWKASGRSKGAPPACDPPTDQNFLNFMQFLENLANLYAGTPSWRVGAPSYGKSWIRPRRLQPELTRTSHVHTLKQRRLKNIVTGRRKLDCSEITPTRKTRPTPSPPKGGMKIRDSVNQDDETFDEELDATGIINITLRFQESGVSQSEPWPHDVLLPEPEPRKQTDGYRAHLRWLLANTLLPNRTQKPWIQMIC